jgi:SAM-dependent methyltransferase
MFRSLLALPKVYALFSKMVSRNARNPYVQDYLRPHEGMRILDLGCGPGDILLRLPKVDYLGIDISETYIQSARRRFGSRGRFLAENVTQTVVREPASFDLVMANGVLHHLDDAEARALLEVACQALKPEGRLVTLDGCWVPGQSPLARLLLHLDRGEHIRTAAAYLTLAKPFFGNIVPHVRHDMLRIPYTHLILECLSPAVSREQRRQCA